MGLRPLARRASTASPARARSPTPDGPVKTLILKPQTFYNESGRAVGEALKFFKIEP